jgi:hypothetical protein
MSENYEVTIIRGVPFSKRWELLERERAEHIASGTSKPFKGNRSTAQHYCCWRPKWVRGSRGNGHFGAAWVTWLRPGVIGPRGSMWLRRRRNGHVEVASL